MYRDLRRCTPRHWIITYILTPQFSWCCLKRGAKHTERFRSFKVGSSAPFDWVQSEGKSTLEKAKKGLNGLSEEWKICQVSMTKNYVQTKVHPALHCYCKMLPCCDPWLNLSHCLMIQSRNLSRLTQKSVVLVYIPYIKKKKKTGMKKKVAFEEAEALKKNSDNGFLSFKILISLLVLLPITTATNSNPSVFNTW